MAQAPQAPAGTQTYGEVTVTLEPYEDCASNYGYVAYRLAVANRGENPRIVTVQLPSNSYGNGDHIRSLTRSVRVESKSALSADILQPPVPIEGSGAVVLIDGRRQREELPVNLVSHLSYRSAENAPVLISRGVGTPVMSSMTQANQELRDRASSSGGFAHSGFGHGGSTYYGSGNSAAPIMSSRPVGEWSEQWLAYSRFQAVLVTPRELQTTTAGVRDALRQYLLAGGLVMVVYDGNGEKPVREAMREALPEGWQTLWPSNEARNLVVNSRSQTTQRLGLGYLETTPTQRLSAQSTNEWEAIFKRWHDQSQPRQVLLGSEEAESSLPMLENQSLPVRGLLALMVVFVLVIGPLNLVALNWKKRRMWLLWTVPLIALLFSGIVFGYSLWSEGIKPRSRSMAFTMLDQDSRYALTVGLTGYYAPLTPGEGFRFGSQTEVIPAIYDDYGYYGRNYSGRPRTLDVSSGQSLDRGWISSRVPTHFVTRTVEQRRERLDIAVDPGGGLRVTNGLGVPIKRLIVADANRVIHEAQSIPAGASVIANSSQRKAGQGDRLMDSVIFNQSLWATSSKVASDPELAVGASTYVAVLDNASWLEPGLAGLTDQETTGVIYGYWSAEGGR